MTKDEAIMVLNMVEAHGLAAEAKRMAIESLSAEPCKSTDSNVADVPSGDLISRADAIKVVTNLCVDGCKAKVDGYFIPLTDALINTLSALPSADTMSIEEHQQIVTELKQSYQSGDLIIKNGKGIQDGLYNIKDGELFKYKAKGGTVRAYKLVPSADRQTDESCQDCPLYDTDNHNCPRFNKVIPQTRAEMEADSVKVAYICDGRKCDNDCSECFRTLDIEHARDFKLLGGTYYQQGSADRPQGEWIVEDHKVVCSICGQNNLETNYCPNCGADMRCRP